MGNSARQVNARVTTDFDRLDADDPSAFAPRIAETRCSTTTWCAAA